ncbi:MULTISPECIES: hypothetical protein [unclassified Pseudomonas]|uniref:hypothetical protein n=1 Tax=unclassified Pseudomonas TaxID=196821 RepID=UPI0025E51357|nr:MULTISPECIES: hypothetical protein [unclassified Pseudomonas]
MPTVTNAVLPEALNKQINSMDAERERMLKPEYAYIIENQSAMLEVWNKTFKG